MTSRRATGSVVKRGAKWYVRLTRPDGKRTTRGSWPTKAAAEAAIPVLSKALIDAASAPQGAVLAQFLAAEYEPLVKTRVAESTFVIFRGQLWQADAWFAEHRNSPEMRAITRADAEEYASHLLESRRAVTVKGHLDTLARCWDHAIGRGYADGQIWRKIRLRKDQERATPWVSPEGLRRMYAHVRTVWARELVQFLAETGMRRGEAFDVNWHDVDLEGATVTARQTKSRKVRTIPLMPSTVELLRQRRSRQTAQLVGEDLVFSDIVSHDMLRYELMRATARAGLPHLRVHDLRHLYASHLVRAGVPVPAVAQLLGHQDGGVLVLQRYGRWAPADAARQAVDRLAAMRAAPKATRSEPAG